MNSNKIQTNSVNICQKKGRFYSNCLLFTVVFFIFWLVAAGAGQAAARTLVDAAGRSHELPDKVGRVICSGSGCLRLLTYLGAQDLAVAVDDIEKRDLRQEARPYALANPQFQGLPLFGEFRGQDNPERILALSPAPQVILKTYSTMGTDPEELQKKTGIPVFVINYGDLGARRADFDRSLRLMAEVVGRKERAEAVIAYVDAIIADLKKRTGDLPEAARPMAYVGGISAKGAHGFASTEPGYPAFALTGAVNVAAAVGAGKSQINQADVSKEQILAWDPQTIFLDLATLQMGETADGLSELKTDPVYRSLSAVKAGRVYGVLPYNWYTINFECLLANCYYVGKTLQPERFADVTPKAKADEIFAFFVGKPVFGQLNAIFQGLAYEPVPLAQ
jgi:iron complex transport system substrate-binding protein